MNENLDKLKIGHKVFNSRLMLGTGKYRTMTDAVTSIEKSECEIVTVAVRRLPTI
jgi:thiazole synthase